MEFPQGFQQSNGGTLYTLDKLEPDTQYSIKYVAEYESKYNYNGNELTFPSESFQVVTTSVTLSKCIYFKLAALKLSLKLVYLFTQFPIKGKFRRTFSYSFPSLSMVHSLNNS